VSTVVSRRGCHCVVAVQHERGPRHSTLRRQISLCLKNSPPPRHHLGSSPVSSLSAAVALAACTPPPPPPSIYRSLALPVRAPSFTASSGSSANSSVFDFRHSSASNRAPLPYAAADVRFLLSPVYTIQPVVKQV